MRALALGLLALAALALPVTGAPSIAPASPAQSAGPYRGVGLGLLDRYRHINNSRFTSDSKDVYRGRFTYTFTIDAAGNVTGTGTGDYLTATWRLDGVHHGHGTFGCDVPMSTKPFRVRITGNAADGVARIRFALEGAREANEEHDCGADFTGYATDSPRLADSLELVQPPEASALSRSRVKRWASAGTKSSTLASPTSPRSESSMTRWTVSRE